MGAQGTEAADRLTRGERAVLAYVCERRAGMTETTGSIRRGTSLATADDMLRRMRDQLGLVACRRVPGLGNELAWEATTAGREALDVRRWREQALDAMERELKRALSPRGWDYARVWARRRLGMSARGRSAHGLSDRDVEHVQAIVSRYLDSATGCS
jgi:hypothetical protein